jgi:class 3 adenylate cyclase/predicted ATPase
LFADLVGFTTLSESLDPEDVKRLVDRAFERLVQDVVAFGGQVDKIVGDAIVALFGAPISHEDDAERAVRAALRMQETLAAYASEAALGIRMRVGVNTGEVLVGALRAGGDYTAMGDVVNIASRLQTSADPGTVVVGEATYLVSNERIRYEPKGAVFTRGREHPVNAWLATEELMPPGYRIDRPQLPLIGRDLEVSILSNSITLSIRNGRAQQVLLLGEAGVGKSRLTQEFVPMLRRYWPDARVLFGRCVPYGEANPWWPIAEILREDLGLTPEASPEATRKAVVTGVNAVRPADDERSVAMVNGLLHVLGVDGPLKQMDASRARAEATRSLVGYLERAVYQRPIAIGISDLHWADDAVLAFVDTVCEELARQPFALVASARRSLMRRWRPQAGRFNQLTINIDPLDEAAAGELLDLIGGDLDPERREMVLTRASGNPFYMEELVTLAQAQREGEEIDLPDTLRGLLSARIDSLDVHERTVLEDAAVWGSSGPLEALRRLAEATRGGGADAATIESLVTKEILIVDGEEWWFRTDLVREVAYSRITRRDRLKRHLGIARFLEGISRRREVDDVYVEVMAHHFRRAAKLAAQLPSEPAPDDLNEKALYWLRAATRRAERSAAWPLCERLASQTLTLLAEAPDPEARMELLLARAKARAEQSRFDVAEADVRTALDIATALENESEQARAITRLGEIAARESRRDDARELLRDAAERYRQLGDDQGRAEALRWQGMALLLINDHDAARAPVEESLSAFRSVGDRRGEAWALQNLAWIEFNTGHMAHAVSWLDESMAAFTEIQDRGGQTWVRGLLAFVRLFEGRLDEALELANDVMREARLRNDRWGQGMMSLVLGTGELWRGQSAVALETMERARNDFASTNDPVGLEMALSLAGRANVSRGQVARGLDLLDQALEIASGSHGRNPGLSEVVSFMTRIELGDTSLRGPITDLLAAGIESGDHFGRADMARTFAMVAAQDLRSDDAARLLEPLVESGDVQATALLAIVALAQGNPERAGELLAAGNAGSGLRYLDRVWLGVAAGLSGIDDGFAVAARALRGTDDQLHPAILALARAVSAGDATEAGPGWTDLGVDPDGWRRLFTAARHAP